MNANAANARVSPVTTTRYRLFPMPLHKALESVVAPVCEAQGFAQYRLLSEWPSIVGKEIASLCVPLKFSGGRSKAHRSSLHISVSPARALEIQHWEPLILERIAIFLGHKAVTRLVLVQDMPEAVRRPGKRAAASCVSSTAIVVEECADDSLRQALQSFADAMKSRQRG